MDIHYKGYTIKADVVDGMWIAECNNLGLVTEAKTYEELESLIKEILPELEQLNK